MNGIVQHIPPLEWVEDQLRRVFGRPHDDRLGVVSMEDDTAYFTVSTHRYVEITGDEVNRAASLLGIEPRAIRFVDSPPNGVRFIVNLAPPTRPETPSAKERG